MYLTHVRQMEINRSLNKQEEDGEWSACSVLLGVMLLIMVGFFLSRYNIPVKLT